MQLLVPSGTTWVMYHSPKKLISSWVRSSYPLAGSCLEAGSLLSSKRSHSSEEMFDLNREISRIQERLGKANSPAAGNFNRNFYIYIYMPQNEVPFLQNYP